jgi:hypothetical protein
MVLKLFKHSLDLTSPVCKWCTYLGGAVLQLDPLRLTMYLSLVVLVSKKNWKGKGGLGPCKTSTALRWERVTFPSSSLYSYCLCVLIWKFWWGTRVKRAKIDPVLVLNAKGGENKGQSDKWISYHLRDFENSRIELQLPLERFWKQ